MGGLLLAVAACLVFVWGILTYTNTPVPGNLTPTPAVTVSPTATTSPPAAASHP